MDIDRQVIVWPGVREPAGGLLYLMGVERDGSHGPNFAPGMALMGKYVLIGEGARGSLAKQLIANYKLDARSEPPKFGIGLKEVWQIDPAKHQKGLIQHSFGWPLNNSTGGGSFLYHYDDNRVAVGFVVHLNYENPYLSPFEEFQRFKTHPEIRKFLEGGKRLAYGARAITAGGLQSQPKLVFPGGALIGDDAGFLNAARIASMKPDAYVVNTGRGELIEEEATVANGLMTATLKIRTEEAIKRYEDRVTKIYTKPGK